MAGLEDEIGRTILDVISADPVNRIRDALMPALQAYKRSGEAALRGPPPGPSFEPNAAGKIPPVDSLSDLPMSAAADVAGMLLPTMGKGTAMFIGPRAFIKGSFSPVESRVMLGRLEEAKSMAARGYPWEEYSTKTGWDNPPGAGWVTQISDEGARINPNVVEAMKGLRPSDSLKKRAPEVFQHPEFYKAVPEAESMPVYLEKNLQGYRSGMAAGEFNPGLLRGPSVSAFGYKRLGETLPHEFQHAEQYFSGTLGEPTDAVEAGIEKFMRKQGISPGALSVTNLDDLTREAYMRSSHEAMAREASRRFNWSFEKALNTPLDYIGDVPRRYVMEKKPTAENYMSLSGMEDLLSYLRRTEDEKRARTIFGMSQR